MSYFAVYALDAPGTGEARATHRPAHRARLRSHDHPVVVQVGGPLLDPEGAMVGSLLIIEAEHAAAVERFVADDPYALAGVYQSVEIRGFQWGLGAPEAANG